MAKGDMVEAFHIEKYKLSDLDGVCKENTRAVGFEKDIIDNSKTVNNYHAATGLPYVRGGCDYRKEIISKLVSNGFTKTSSVIKNKNGYAIRSDATWMGSIVVSCPDVIELERRPKFFKAAYEFFATRFGVENIVDDVVHIDETKDDNFGLDRLHHMHLNFVPLTDDGALNWNKAVGNGKADRKVLKQLHTDFTNHMKENGFDLIRGETIENDAVLNEMIKELQNHGIDIKPNLNAREFKRNLSKILKKLKADVVEMKTMKKNLYSAKEYIAKLSSNMTYDQNEMLQKLLAKDKELNALKKELNFYKSKYPDDVYEDRTSIKKKSKSKNLDI